MNITKKINNDFSKKFLCIEGNIGSGKSTFIKKLLDSLDFSIVYEPTNEWQDINGINALDIFYKDTKRWAYSFQSYVFLTRIKAIEEEYKRTKKDLFFAERSVFADRYAFGKVCHDLYFINELEWNMYCKWHKWMIEEHTKIPAGFIYLKVDPNIAYSRIKKRGRFEESSISLDYLTLLNNCHEDWLINKKNVYNIISNIPVLVLDCNEDFEYNEDNWKILLKYVNNFIINNIYDNNLFIGHGEENGNWINK